MMILNSVGLFVDYENIYISLANVESRPLRHDIIARRLIDLARAYGELTYMVAWADWDRFPGAQRVFATSRYETRFVPTSSTGKNSADMAMQAEILKILNTDNAPSRFVIATGDRDFIFTVDELKRQSRQVVLVGVDGTTSMDLKRAAHEFVPLQYSAAPADDPYAAPPEAAVAGPRREGTGGESRVPVEVLEQIRATLTDLLTERHLPWISYRLLSNHLVTNDLATPELVHRWIEKAVEEGYIIREEERGAVKRFAKFMPARRSGATRAPAPAEAAPPVSRPTPPPAQASAPRWTEPRPAPPEMARAPGARGAGWSQDWRNFTFVKITWALQSLLVDKPPRFYINPSSLLEAIRKEGIGYSEEEVFFWVNQSVDKGVLIREIKEVGPPGGQRYYRYYINHHSRLVLLADEVPRAILQTIDHVLKRRSEWTGIAFNFLIKLLQVHPMLSNPANEFQPYRIREWINFLIDEGLLSKFEEPDLKEPSRTTTMVTLGAEHAQTRRFLSQATSAPFLAPEHQAVLRTILTIDHFLHWLRTKSPDEDWLPLMTLKSWLRASLGDQLTKWAIAECEREAIFTIDRFQNKGGVEATVAGVRLDYHHPVVVDALNRRDEFLRLLISLLRNRATIPYGLLEQRLREHEGFGSSPEERLGWLSLMADTKIVTLEREAGADESQRAFICRINAREKFVGELLTRVIREGQGRAAGGDETRTPLPPRGEPHPFVDEPDDATLAEETGAEESSRAEVSRAEGPGPAVERGAGETGPAVERDVDETGPADELPGARADADR